MQTVLHLLLIAVTWSVYFWLHSFLASERCKAWVAVRIPRFAPVYRLTYNLLSLIFLIPPGALTLIYPGPVLWHRPRLLALAADGLALAALVGFVWSLRYYDGLSFLGVRQWRGAAAVVDGAERLVISPLHRYVRHPWYFFLLVILWTREMSLGDLTFAIVATTYLVIGSRREEEKLVTRYGEAYRRYQSLVPALLPMPGRVLSVQEAERLRGEST